MSISSPAGQNGPGSLYTFPGLSVLYKELWFLLQERSLEPRSRCSFSLALAHAGPLLKKQPCCVGGQKLPEGESVDVLT